MSKPGLFVTQYLWTPALLTRLRAAYASQTKRGKSLALDALEASTGWPRSAFVNKAGAMGLTTERRTWTASEDKVIRMWAGEAGADKIARHLGRSRYSVQHRIWQLEMSTRVRSGYSVRDLTQIFGASVGRVNDWIDRGLLGRPEPTNAGVRVADEDLVQFIRHFPDEYSLRTCDETFVKGVLFGHRQGLSGEVAPHAARGSGKKKDTSRGFEGNVRGALPERGRRGRAGGNVAGLEASRPAKDPVAAGGRSGAAAGDSADGERRGSGVAGAGVCTAGMGSGHPKNVHSASVGRA